MKIDSPTFLTETTFVSASVQFSSGSQKFGNTSDDTHQFTGSLSVTGSAKITANDNATFHVASSTTNNDAFVRITEGSNYFGGFIKYAGTPNILELGVHNANDSDVNNDTTAIQILRENNVGDVIFPIANQKISGSSTSTGSFGHGYIDSKLGIGTTTPAGLLHVKNAGGSSTIFVDGDTGAWQTYAFKSGGSTVAEIANYHQTRMELKQHGGTFRFNTIGGTQYVEINSSGIEAKVGNISGSSTSTGSFQTIRFGPPGRNFQFYESGNDAYFGGGGLRIGSNFAFRVNGGENLSTGGTATITRIDNVSSNIYFAIGGDGGSGDTALLINTENQNYLGLGLRTNSGLNTPDVIKIHDEAGYGGLGANVVEFATGSLVVSSGNISGSSTSTGSFGHLEVKRNINLTHKSGQTSTTQGVIDINSSNSGGDAYLMSFNNADSDFYIKSDQGRMQFYSSPSPSYDAAPQSGYYFMANMDGDDAEYLTISNGNITQKGLVVGRQVVSGSAISTGSFAKLSLGTGTVSDTSSGQVGVELGSKSISGNNAFVIAQKDGTNRQTVFYARSGSNGGYETFLGSDDGYNFGYVRGWTGKLYMQGQHLASRNAGANTTLAFQGTGGISANKVGVSNHAITGSSAKFDFYTYGGGKFDIRSYYNETFQFRVNSGTAAAPEYATRLILGNRAGGGKIGLGGVTNPTEAVHIGAGSNLRNTGSFGDIRLYVDGNISGSATSTGSFGSVSTKRLDVGGYYVAQSGGVPVTSGDITLGTTNVGKKVGLEIYHSTNPVSFKLHYDSGGGAVTLDNVHQNYINDFIFKKAGSEYWRIGTGLNTTSDVANNAFLKMANSSFDYMILDEGDDTMFYIDTSTNNIGIGDFTRNSVPAAKLHVVGEVSMSHAARTTFNALDIKSSYSATRGSTIRGFRTGSDYEWQLGDYGAVSGNTSRGLGLTSRTSIYLSPNASTVRMIIDGSSRVSLSNNDSGTNNTIFGNLAGANTSGDYNVYLGGEAGNGNTSGDSNVVIGYRAGTTTGTYSNSTFIGIQAGQLTTTGNNNTFVGWDAGRYNVNSSLNTYLGYGTGKYQRGSDNVFLGGQAGFGKSSSPYSNGIRNVAVGTYALVNTQASQSYCVAIGHTAGYYTTGSYNTFIGHQTGYGGTSSAPYSSGQYNTGVGSFALQSFTTGTQNVAIGYQAANDLTTGYYNAIVGYQAGQNVTTGNSSVFVGWQAGNNKTTVSNNIGIGYRSAYADGGTMDVFIGYEAGANATGGNNIGIGRDAGRGYHGVSQTEYGANSTNTQNVSIGTYAYGRGIGSSNVNIGYNSGYYMSGSQNTNIGHSAGKGAVTSAPFTSGQYNTNIGYYAGQATSTGNYNINLGPEAYGASTGDYNITMGWRSMFTERTTDANIAMGYSAMYYAGQGGAGYNIAIGHQCMYGTSAGGAGGTNIAMGHRTLYQNGASSNNVAIGHQAGYQNVTGGSNVLLGAYAGYHQLAGSSVNVGYESGQFVSGSHNVFIGTSAGKSQTYRNRAPYSNADSNIGIGTEAMYYVGTNAQYNVAIGRNSLHSIVSGSSNIALGYQAGDAITTGTNNIMIGQSVDVSSATAINEIVIGNTTHTGSFKMGAGANNGTAQTQGAQVLAQSLYLKQIGLDHDKSGTDGVGDMENVLLTLHGAYDDDAIGGRGIAMSFKMQDESTNVGEMGRISIIPRSGNMNSNLSAYGTEMYFYNSVAGTLTKQMELSGGDGHANVGIFGDSSTIAALRVYNDGNNANRDGILIHAGADDGSGTTAYIDARDGDGDQVGHISNTSGTFALTDVSDKRLKKNIVDTTIKGVDTINKMKVRDFEWIKSGDKSIGGFIAQELAEVFPSAVTGEDDAMEDILDKDYNKIGERIKPMGVSRENLVPVLIKAVQELSETIESQQKEIEELKNK